MTLLNSFFDVKFLGRLDFLHFVIFWVFSSGVCLCSARMALALGISHLWSILSSFSSLHMILPSDYSVHIVPLEQAFYVPRWGYKINKLKIYNYILKYLFSSFQHCILYLHK